ncbi:hypothetical protein CORC01_01288 [Colletotrichum orchidophilum]|uniref:C2H2-type domain-containing protein n=1 Tax=Colletotrichum orchidophilum TaxID=1209926 RepID=A0A1G4BQ51_9PEZI|nr:uncharacterized protein CORC01_01288 [Colletotrichum orchidophilum]OHF03569.1 hypothetical protein CORC01_01288 [Colletotrichum orchidophilum]
MAPPTAVKRPHAAMSKGSANLPSIEPWLELLYPDFDCSKYNYVGTDDGGFWQLQQQHTPSEELPNVVPRIATSKSPIQTPQDIEWTCLSAACPSKPFKRKGDLDRHYKLAHADSQTTAPSPALSLKDITPATSTSNPSPKITTKKPPAGSSKAKAKAAGGGGTGTTGTGTGATGAMGPSGQGNRNNSVNGAGNNSTSNRDGSNGIFLCDYPACNRKNEPFNRKDRLRIHLTDVHKEDVSAKTFEMTVTWLHERKIYPKWWRCSKCLDRVKIEENGWSCPRDGSKVEEIRREFREKQHNMS